MALQFRSGLLAATMLVGAATGALAAPLVTAAVDDKVTVAVKGDLSPMLDHVVDHGQMGADEAIPHVMVVLKRAPAQQAALDKLVADQLNKASPSYHHWLTPAQLRNYGPAQEDIDKTVAWLKGHGLTIVKVAPTGMSIDVAGSPRAFEAAFHTALHHVTLPNGEAHVAAITQPAIPAALSPIVRGAVLSNFFPKPNFTKLVAPSFNVQKSGFQAVAPADFATIYNANPLLGPNNYYGAPVTGKGVTIAVVEQTNINPDDWATFRKAFGLSLYKGTLTSLHPSCKDPGITSDVFEASLDAEWASAVAPDANIIEASCRGTAPFEFGVMTALENLVENPTPATIFSISYGGPETGDGLTFLQAWSDLTEAGAAEGKTIVVSTGDSGVAGETNKAGFAYTGLAVNGLSTTPYVTAVGGTDFFDTAQGTSKKYWAKKNGAFFASALSYIPEMPWNNSCASSVLTQLNGYADSIVSCNQTKLPDYEQQGVGGTGGQSVIVAKPDWEVAPGVPDDGVRDQPDVALFAANGTFGHFYVACMSIKKQGGVPCNYNVTDDVFRNAAGGTSFAAPAFAGIMALVASGGYNSAALGNAAPRLYQLASAQYTNTLLLKECNSLQGASVGLACVFNNVTVGNNAEPCVADTANCYTTSESTNGIGVLAAPFKKTEIDAFPTQIGYSLATGLGTINVYNLVINY